MLSTCEEGGGVHVVGEAARQVSREFSVTHSEVVHDYLGMDEDVVWQVVTGDLPKLVESLDRSSRPRLELKTHRRGCADAG